MRDGHCPKCGSTDVYSGESTHAITEASRIQIYKPTRFIPDLTVLDFIYYVCQKCGYFESYVSDLDQLSKLTDSDNWTKVKS